MNKWERLLKDYEAGQLNEADQAMVKAKLAELNALQDYLWQQEEVDVSIPTEFAMPLTDSKKINSQVTRKLWVSVLSILAIITAVGSLFYFFLLPVVEKTYFDPRVTSGETKVTDYQIYQTLYNELTNYQFQAVGNQSERLGFATYQVETNYQPRFNQSDSRGVTTLTKFNRGERQLAALESSPAYPLPNYRPLLKNNQDDEQMMADSLAQTVEKLKELPLSVGIDGVISFTQPQDFQQLITYFDEAHLIGEEQRVVWVSISIADSAKENGSGAVFGLNISESLGLFPPQDARAKELNKKYPELFPMQFDYSREAFTAETYATHFKSVIMYLIDHQDLLEQMDSHYSVALLKEALAYVEKNGVKANALYLSASKDKYLAFLAKQPIWQTEILNVDLFREQY